MALRHSRMLELGTPAPDFKLPDPSGRMYSLAYFKDAPALLVAFICNHCPFVQHIRAGFVQFASEYQAKGLAIVAISSNDAETHPQDGPKQMAIEAARAGFVFPYLYDESQAVAKAYEAICTPDFFLFDRERRLVYRGQFDSSRPNSKTPVTGKDLAAAADILLAGYAVPGQQFPSAGCSIKWKPGNEPGWA